MGNHRHYKIRDYQFGFKALLLREKAGLTQAEIATLLHVTERTIQYWEGGSSHPAPTNLRKLIALYLSHGAFTPGHEHDEAKVLWEQAYIHTTRWHVSFDDAWFTTLLTSYRTSTSETTEQPTPLRLQSPTSFPLSDQDEGSEETTSLTTPALISHTLDWGEATDISTFYGREQELAELEHWLCTDQCRLVALLGMGGIGKTTLSIKLAQQVAHQFDFVLWRSLRNAPPFEEIIDDCIQSISKHPYTQSPHNNEMFISLFIDLLRRKRCLLIFDNIDVLLQEGDAPGHYRAGYEAYKELIQRIAETPHKSCLLLTSREMLGGLGILHGLSSPVRILKLAGLGQAASQQMLKDKELFGEQEAWSLLIQRYGGNPLALKIVAEAVRELFGGDIAAFLHEGYVIFHDILRLLNHQFARLSTLEQDVMYWLAIERDPVSLAELGANFIHTLPKSALLQALNSLLRRCLIERSEQGAIFTLQPVVLEYVTEHLVEQVTHEISQDTFTTLMKYALMKAQAKEYIRNSQLLLVLQPTLKKLLAHFGNNRELERHLLSLLSQLKTIPQYTQGYAGGNIVNLLATLRENIRGLDFSHLMIRQAYLQGIEAQDANFAGSNLMDSVFMETFDAVVAVAVSPNGKYLAAGSFNGQICTWLMADGKPVFTLKGHISIAWCLAFSPNSQLLASGGYDCSVKLWDINNGQCVRVLSGHTEWIRAVVFSPDGRLLASSGDDKTIRIWRVEDGTCLHVLHGHAGLVLSIAFYPAENILVSVCNHKMIKWWDIATGECLTTLLTPAKQIIAVAVSPDGKLIATGENEGIRIWDRNQPEALRFLPTGMSWNWTIVFISEETLASGGDDGNVIMWDVSSGQRLRTLQDHHSYSSRIWSLAVAPGNLLISGSYAGRVKFWDTTTGHCLRTLHGHNRVICSLAFSPDSRILINGDNQGIIRIWEVGSGRCLQTIHGHKGRIWSAAFSPDGKTFATGGNDMDVKVWDIQSGHCLRTFQGHLEVIRSVAFSPDGALLASGCFDLTIKVWQVREPESNGCYRNLQWSNWIWSIAFSPDSKLLAGGSVDGAVTLWDVAGGTCINNMHGDTSPVGSVAFSPDGKTLVSSSNSEFITVWDVASGHSLKTIREVGNANWVKSVAFSPDGTMLATGCKDRTIKVWNVETEQEVWTLTGHKGGIWSVAFSPDGNTIATGSDDGIILLWSTQTGTTCGTLQSDRPFERMNISGAIGITQAQKDSLVVLGAIESNDDGDR